MKSRHQETKIKQGFSIFFIGISLFLLAISPINHQEIDYLAEYEPSQEQILRFGITLPYLTGNYVDLVNQINAKAVLDWRQDDKNEWVEHSIDYLHVIKVSDAAYNDGAILDSLEALVLSNKGEVWIIGNEPDRFYYQDSITAEVYAKRYYEIGTRIRFHDPTAQLGFGSVVQPTPIRLRYLQRALDHLTFLSCGNREAALDLIDIWSIHAFILNEHPNEWGAGVPVGFENDWSDAISITDFSDTHSIEIFSERINDFRIWMNSIGEKEKPLWITEYGSLFPPITTSNLVTISDDKTVAFMIETFNFMLSEVNITYGYLHDNNRLVQRWFWYSLNGSRDEFGGTLFDPDNSYSPTLVGQEYKNYTDQIVSSPISSFKPIIYRQTNQTYSVYFNDLLGIYNYPYASCFGTQLPLVFK